MTQAVRLDFPTWTPIAARGREPVSFGAWNKLRGIPGKTMAWCAYPDAPMTIEGARALEAAGHLLIMNRHFADKVEVVIRSAPEVKLEMASPPRSVLSMKHEVALAKADAWRAPLPSRSRR